MSQGTKRWIFRTIHIVFSIPIAGYIYSPTNPQVQKSWRVEMPGAFCRIVSLLLVDDSAVLNDQLEDRDHRANESAAARSC
jgi:hypothetical protein